MMKKLLFCLILVAGCRSASVAPDVDRLSGRWRWVESTGGIAGFRYTPADQNYSVELRFAGNQVTALRNDSVKTTSSFTIRGDEVTYQPSISAFTFDGGIDTQTLRVVAADTVMLSDPCCDMFSHLFVRVR